MIKINKNGDELLVSSPHNPKFVARARKLGKWKPPHWVFDSRNEEFVRGLLIKCYGNDTFSDTVTVKVEYDRSVYADKPPHWVFDSRNEEFVRELLIKSYGADGTFSDTVTVNVEYEPGEYADKAPIELFGRIVARAYGVITQVPKLTASQVTEELAFYSRGLRLMKRITAIQRANWTVEIDMKDTVMEDCKISLRVKIS